MSESPAENSDGAAGPQPQPDVQPISVTEPGEPGLEAAPGPQLSDVMTEEEFAEVFASLFPLAAGLYAMRDPPELQSLMQAPNLPTARPAFGALYRCANRYEWLRWLIEKDNAWLADAILIGGFGSQVYVNVSVELQQRREVREAHWRREEQRRARDNLHQRRDGHGQDNPDAPPPAGAS
ncbi:MAG TPA: hypothetical protein VKR31_10165 [Rhizomicrobium sp.]|nr:hypothetical protein [Rhizomicrobium sp.]